MGPTGATGHTGLDGSSPFDRMDRYMSWEATAGENIMYSSRSPMQVLVSLAVDDGVPGRGHRDNIMSTAYAYSGGWTDMHEGYGTQTVIGYSGAWEIPDYASPSIPVPQTMAEAVVAGDYWEQAADGTATTGGTETTGTTTESDGEIETCVENTEPPTDPAFTTDKECATEGGICQCDGWVYYGLYNGVNAGNPLRIYEQASCVNE